MSRIWLLLLAVIASCPSLASATEPKDTGEVKKPLGTWKLDCLDGSTATLLVEEKSITWKFQNPEKGETTLLIPSYTLSGERVLYGYVSEASWTNGTNSSKSADIYPFAFRMKLDDKSLTISDLRMVGTHQAGLIGISGTYSLATDVARSKSKDKK